jgi:tRNA threonylcarbamoyladenosine biosynthesis protein TsaE
MLTVQLPDEEATVAAGRAIGEAIARADAAGTGLVIHLQGDLGAGKTTLCRGILRAFGHAGAVKSPTYTLVETYALPSLTLHHFDLYRLHDPEELEFMGIRDYFGAHTLALVEWPQRGEGHFPVPDLIVNLAVEGVGRVLSICAGSPAGKTLLEQLEISPKH